MLKVLPSKFRRNGWKVSVRVVKQKITTGETWKKKWYTYVQVVFRAYKGKRKEVLRVDFPDTCIPVLLGVSWKERGWRVEVEHEDEIKVYLIGKRRDGGEECHLGEEIGRPLPEWMPSRYPF